MTVRLVPVSESCLGFGRSRRGASSTIRRTTPIRPSCPRLSPIAWATAFTAALLVAVLAVPTSAVAQKQIDLEAVLNTWDGQPVETELYAFRSVPEAERVVSCIANEVGVRPDSFVVQAANVPSAAAATAPAGCGNITTPCKRLLLYNPAFIHEANELTNNKWGGVAVMAHEIAHHLEAHTIRPGGRKKEDELEADEQAGWMLRKLGATLDEAQSLFRTFDDQGGSTHPPRSARLAAVANGWDRAGAVSPTSCYSDVAPGRETTTQRLPPIDFGDDSGFWPRDGECDDARFEGPGRSIYEGDDYIGRDRSDCHELFISGQIRVIDGQPKRTGSGGLNVLDVEFGDDSGGWPHDGECDDTRFTGPGRSVYSYDDYVRRDASDCRELFISGRITLVEANGEETIDFGDNTAQWAYDGECDDSRFSVLARVLEVHDYVLRDAYDCRRLFAAGEVEYLGEP